MTDPRFDLLAWLDANAARPRDTLLADLGHWISRTDRPLADAWWHAGDVDAAYEWATRRLTTLGLVPMTRETFDAWQTQLETIADEEIQRRHQLGLVAVHANAQLGTARRFHCAGKALSWESDEPAWLLLDEREHARIVALTGEPPALESAYSGKTEPRTTLATHAQDISEMSPAEAELAADKAYYAGRYDEALRYQERVSERGDHGLLARLRRIELLDRVQRRDEARVLWNTTADEWLSGQRRVWDTQWKALLDLHGRLGLADDDARLPNIRARTPKAPAPVLPAAPPSVCPLCKGKGWTQKDASSFPERCACKRQR